MNQELARPFFIKLLIVSIAVLVLNHFLVRPKTLAAQDLGMQYQSQMDFIVQGEQHIRSSREQIEQSVHRMNEARDLIFADLGGDRSVQSHQLLQRYAAKHELTVTRIEPQRAAIKETRAGVSEQVIQIELKDFRIECHGSFTAVIAFIAEVQQGQRQGRIKDFRLVPSGDQTVRASLLIQLVELSKYPELLDSPEWRSNSNQQHTKGAGGGS